MIHFLSNFLKNKLIQVKANNTLSSPTLLTNGVPQGSVLSVTLFLVAINDIVTNINFPVKCCLFADDLTLLCSGNTPEITQSILQNTLNKLQTWSSSSGFKFSPTKSEYIIFSKKRKKIPNHSFSLKLNDQPLNRTNKIKILGLIFDPTLSWKDHIINLKQSTLAKLNLLKTLSARNWGADHQVLMNTYKAIILSKLDYGSIFYGPSIYAKDLDPIHNLGLKIAIGAYHTSPTASILAEANVPPLRYRRTKLMSNYVCKLIATPSNPTFELVLATPPNMYSEYPNSPKPLSTRFLDFLITNDVNIPDILSLPPIRAPPEILNLSITEFPEQILEIHNVDYTKYYTHGISSHDYSGAAITYQDNRLLIPLPKTYSSLEANAVAILKALELANNSTDAKVVIFTPCISLLPLLKNPYSIDPTILNIQDLLLRSSKLIRLTHNHPNSPIIPHSHLIAVAKVDALEAATMDYKENDIPLQAKDVIKKISKQIMEKWNQEWRTNYETYLHKVRTNTLEKSPATKLARQDQISITRLRIGHSKITHSHIITKNKKNNPEICKACLSRITLNHLMLECPLYDQQRRLKNIQEDWINGLNSPEYVSRIVQYLKSTNLQKLL